MRTLVREAVIIWAMKDELPAGRVGAVVVTYHPDHDLAARVCDVMPQVRATIVVDNGSSDAELHSVRGLSGGSPVRLICNDANLGIARALNIGIETAITMGFCWVLLLDQDTQVDPDMVQQLLAAHASCDFGSRVAAVGSRYRDPNGPPIEPIRLASCGTSWEEVESVITSGTLLSLPAYQIIGPFREEFFIDHVDTEYCFRAREADYRVIETVRPLMSHTVGAPTSHTLLGSTSWTTNHSPDRRYYMARNNTVLLREYGTSGRGPWQWKSIVRCLRLCKRILYFERNKSSKITAVAQGWWDGVRGKMGPRPHRSRG